MVPIRLSTLLSTDFWNNCGVVVDENVDCITMWVSVEYVLMWELIMVVLAEPCSPISKAAYSFLATIPIKNSVRILLTLGMSSELYIWGVISGGW